MIIKYVFSITSQRNNNRFLSFVSYFFFLFFFNNYIFLYLRTTLYFTEQETA